MSITLHNMKGLSEKIIRILRSEPAESPRPNGVQRFEVGNQIVWALNKKNAERKAKLYPDKEIIGG